MPTPILMPALSPTMEEGKLAKWHVKEGDSVSSGDVIAEIETDKATMEVEAVDEGTVGRIVVAEGTDAVAVNATIAVLLEEGEDASALDDMASGNGAPAPAASPAPPPPAAAPAAASADTPDAAPVQRAAAQQGVSAANGSGSGGRIFASPLARRIAAEAGIDLKAVAGSGPHGRIVKADIEAAATSGTGKAAPTAAAASPAPVPAAPRAAADPRKIYPEGSYTEVPADNMRKTIARRLAQSFQEVPHFPLTVDCELDALLKLRAELNAKAPEGTKISVNDFLIKASALALKKVPDSNATWAGDAILKHRHADVAVAVAIPGGLITPIIFAAETKGLATISKEMKDLAARARDGKLQPAEYQGGTFSLSNLGMFGIRNFASIVNQPQGMILSVGAGEARPVVKDGALAIATVMSVTLTCDHRVVDGAVGAAFCQAFKGFVEDPVSMML